MNDHFIFNYNDIFFSCFFEDDRTCTHRSREFALNYVYSGEMILDDGHKQMHVGKGECVYVPRDLSLTLYKQPKNGEPYQGIFVSFTRDLLRQMYDSVGATRIAPNTPRLDRGPIKLPHTAEITSLFASLTPYLSPDAKPSDDIMRLKQQEALLALLHIDPRFAPTLFDFSAPWKIDILDFLNENYMHELTTEDMAHYTGRSLASFKRDFKKVSDLTPEKWLIRKRLEVAYDLLSRGASRIVDVCYQVGFKNPSHFSTSFKRCYGKSPARMIRRA